MKFSHTDDKPILNQTEDQICVWASIMMEEVLLSEELEEGEEATAYWQWRKSHGSTSSWLNLISMKAFISMVLSTSQSE